ncbi:MAG: EAL domain-containing protein, partial [Lachnospiraceae bacterium]|nr:EAL domain-containing protein [Lachnospiraceae bacterium]
MKDYIIQNLDNAIENGYIKVYYQPVARTISGEICGVEALARWEDPEKGMIMPGDFIPVLEEAELIHKLDTEMIRLICRNYKKHRDLGHTMLPVSFNMSWLDFKKADMVAILENEALECDMPRNMIRVEFTESALAEDHEFMLDVFRRLDDAGFKVWMDDFGSGYSSLNILKDVSFHTLKLDMEFLHDFSDRSKVIISSLIDMAKKVGVHTLAEGVETLEQYEFLARVGCEKVQGYYFG